LAEDPAIGLQLTNGAEWVKPAAMKWWRR